MSTRHTSGPNIDSKYSSESNDLHIPSCTVEDVDRAVFNLFDKDYSILKDSPHPQRSVSLGFLKTKEEENSSSL